jgi:hypothetical protein
MESIRKLWAGPMVGEFGWMLFCWQGILRKIAKNYSKVYVAGRPGHNVIYEDFAEYIPIETIGDETSGMRNCDYKYQDEHKKYDVDDVILPETYLTHYNPRKEDNSRFLNTKQEFIKYGKQIATGISLLVHARYTNKWKSSYRNWSKEKWDVLTNELVKQGYQIGAIGKTGQAYLPEGCWNLMDIDLRTLTNYMRSTKIIIGPSSGPMHLAALCDLKRVVWGMPELEKTYKYHWNPFNVTAEFIEGWSPGVDNVLIAVDKLLKT